MALQLDSTPLSYNPIFHYLFTDHYVVINMRQDGKVIATKETKGASGLNPTWNAPFLFDLPLGDITQLPLVFEFIIMQVGNSNNYIFERILCSRSLKIALQFFCPSFLGSFVHQEQCPGSSSGWQQCFRGGAGTLEGNDHSRAVRDSSLAHHSVRCVIDVSGHIKSLYVFSDRVVCSIRLTQLLRIVCKRQQPFPLHTV